MSCPLLLLPGLLNDHRLWDPVAEALAGTVPVLVKVARDDDSVAAMAARILAEAPPRFALGGLSMGGYVAMEIMRQAPERVERLALVSTTARPDLPEQSQRRRDAIALAQAGGFDKIMPTMLPLLLHADQLRDVSLTALLRDMAQAIGPDGFARQQTAIMNRPDSRPDLSGWHLPALVLFGAQDQLTPPDRQREMAERLPNARLVALESCGHLSAIEQPRMAAAALRSWLEM